MLKTVVETKQGDQSQFYIGHHLDVLRLIIHVFIRSAWVLEGIAANAEGGQNQAQGDENLQSLVKLTCSMIRACENECRYVTLFGKDESKMIHKKARKDDIVLVVHFLIRRLTLDNRGPSHPATYDQVILQSELFKPGVFGKIMEWPLEGEKDSDSNPDRCARSKLKTAFIACLGAICSNDPAQIPKAIENGLLDKVTNTVKKGLPVHRRTMYILFDFLRVIVVHEKGKEYIKESGLFLSLMQPCTEKTTDAERTGAESDQNNLAFVILASN